MSWPFAGLLLFFVVYCARPEDIIHLNTIPIAKIAAVLAIGAFGFAVLTRPEVLKISREMRYLVLLVAWLGIGVPFSPVWPAGALQMTLTFAKVIPITLMVGIVANSLRRLKALILVQTASAMMVVLLTMAKFGIHPSEDKRLTGVLGDIYGNPNALAFALVLVIPFCVLFIVSAKNLFKKLFWTVVASVMVYGVLMTYSRGGLLALVMAGGIILLQFGLKERRYGLVLLAILLGIGLFLFVGPHGYFRRVETIVDPNVDFQSDKGSWEARQALLIRSLEITAQHPVFGVGAGNFTVVSGDWHVTHNTYTELSAEGGIPAFFLYMLTLWATFANLRETGRLSKDQPELRFMRSALLASFGAFLVGSFFYSVGYNFLPYFLVGYSSVLVQIARAGARPESEIMLVDEENADFNGPTLNRLREKRQGRFGGAFDYQPPKSWR